MALQGLVDSSFRTHISNAAYGALDYLAYPVGMLVIAPIALRALGMSRYGVWTFTTAVVSTGSIIASGFGDANIRHVATERSRGDSRAIVRAVRSTMGIHLLLGTLMALVLLLLAPSMAFHVAANDGALRLECLWSLIIAGLIVLLRAIESVCISSQRAFERYGQAIRVSMMARILTLLAAAILPVAGAGVLAVMVATAALTLIGLSIQIADLRKLLRCESLSPTFDREATQALLGFGIFTWIQAVGGLLFGQVDRLVTGIALGAAAVTSYALCVQMAQPIYGLSAATLHFLFPYLSAKRASSSELVLRRAVILGSGANLLLVLAGTLPLLIFGQKFLQIWAGPSVATAGRSLLPTIIWGAALPGLNVTASYALLALGRVRTVTCLNLVGGALMVLLVFGLLPRYGLYGVAIARLAYGSVTLLAYLPLIALLRRSTHKQSAVVCTNSLCGEA